MAIHYFPIREVDRPIFEDIKSGVKNIETRAGGPKYKNIKAGDEAVFKCGSDKITKKIKEVSTFKSVKLLVKKYGVKPIAPWLETEKDLEKLYYGFPGYRERIVKYGIIAMEL